MVKTSFEDTYPWNDSNRWGVSTSVDTMKWVIKAWDEGLVEAQSDLDSLESENATLKGMKDTLEDDDTISAGGTSGSPRGPPPRTDSSTSSEKKKYNKPLTNIRTSEMQARLLSRNAGSGWDQQEGVSLKRGAS